MSSDIVKAIQGASEADLTKLDAEIKGVEAEMAKLQNKIDGLRLAKKVLSTVLHGLPQRVPRGMGKAALAKAAKAAKVAAGATTVPQSTSVASDIKDSLSQRIAELLGDEGSLPIIAIAKRLNVTIPLVKGVLSGSNLFRQHPNGEFNLR